VVQASSLHSIGNDAIHQIDKYTAFGEERFRRDELMQVWMAYLPLAPPARFIIAWGNAPGEASYE